MNKRFYFTYGTGGQPFYGGWTVVEAPNYSAACAAFRAYHPDKMEGLLHCSRVYDEGRFMETEMARSGNFGARCHEIISMQRRDAAEKIVDGKELPPLAKVLGQTNRQISEIRDLLKQLMQTEAGLIWQLHDLSVQCDRVDKPKEATGGNL